MTTKSQLITSLATALDISKKSAALVLNTFGNITVASLKAEGVALIPGIGKLKTKVRPGREGRNPKTGAAITIASRQVVKLVPSKSVKTQVNS